ncbi:MAG: leucine-rich repeat domain-containing protein, partial [Candidatus Heimdallarchaeaceae archaeon]
YKILPFYIFKDKWVEFQLETVNFFEVDRDKKQFKILGLLPEHKILALDYQNNSFLHLDFKGNVINNFPSNLKLKKMNIAFSYSDIVIGERKTAYVYDFYGRLICSFKTEIKFNDIKNSERVIAFINSEEGDFTLTDKQGRVIVSETISEPFFRVDYLEGELLPDGSLFMIKGKTSGSLSTNYLERKVYYGYKTLNDNFSTLVPVDSSFYKCTKNFLFSKDKLLLSSQYRLLTNYLPLIDLISPEEDYAISLVTVHDEKQIRFIDLWHGSVSYYPLVKLTGGSIPNKNLWPKEIMVSKNGEMLLFEFHKEEHGVTRRVFLTAKVTKNITKEYRGPLIRFLGKYVEKDEMILLTELFATLGFKFPSSDEHHINFLARLFEIQEGRVTELNLKNALWGRDLWKLKLPNTVFEFKMLKSLSLSKNKLERIPENIGELRTIQYLDLSENKIVAINDNKIEGMQKLETLDLRKNDLTEFPISVLRLNNLKMLYLQKNNIKEIKREIEQIQNIKLINLQKNPISKLIKKKKLPGWFYQWLKKFEEKGGVLVF